MKDPASNYDEKYYWDYRNAIKIETRHATKEEFENGLAEIQTVYYKNGEVITHELHHLVAILPRPKPTKLIDRIKEKINNVKGRFDRWRYRLCYC